MRPVRAALALRHNNGAGAIADLRPASPYELRVFDALYLRGLAYLATGDGAGAAEEFTKVLNNRGVDPVSPLYPLSRLGLARADALQKDFASIRSGESGFVFVSSSATTRHNSLPPTCKVVSSQAGKARPERKTEAAAASSVAQVWKYSATAAIFSSFLGVAAIASQVSANLRMAFRALWDAFRA